MRLVDGDRAAFNSDGVLQSVVYPNADLVIIPTARPIGDITTSAYAQCLQRDQHVRRALHHRFYDNDGPHVTHTLM